ncbi:MAG: histidine kinase [Ginsengibacter sp.]
MQLNGKKRYSLYRITLVVGGFYAFIFLLGFALSTIAPLISSTEMSNRFSLRTMMGKFAGIAFYSLFYYVLINAYYQLLVERKTIMAFIKPTIIGLAAIFAFFGLNELFITERNINITIDGKITNPITPVLLVISFTISSIFFTGLSFLTAYLTSLRDERKDRKLLEKQTLQLEFEKSQANFNFLKAQINPHFLHNTLNFLYAKSLPYSEELSEGILTLSDIMRYALNEGNTKNGKVPLNDELEHLGNVIKINQLRFSNELQVIFEVEGNTAKVQIIPFVLITLVENAFKHGDLISPGHPLTIRLNMHDHQLSFFCSNKKKVGLKELSTGIGLDNIKKRLELTYGSDFSLTISDELDFYTTRLNIQKL